MRRTDGDGQAQGTVPTAYVEELLLSLLDQLRKRSDSAQGYGPANLIALLRVLRGHLCGLDLSLLSLRGAYLQSIEMRDAKLTGAQISDIAFTEAVSATRAVAISLDGTLWAAGGVQGKVRVWNGGGQILQRIWQAHTGLVYSLAFSPDGRTLASGSRDGTLKLWDVGGQTGATVHLESVTHLRTLRRDRPYEGLNITGTRELNEAQKSTLQALGAIEEAAP